MSKPLAMLFAMLVFFIGGPAAADSWEPAKRAVYLSPDGGTRLTVVPREIADRLAYFADKVDGRAAAGQRPGGQPRATANLERRVGGVWTRIWTVPLVNDIAPVRALVANEGRYVVTFDDWHSVGLGEHVVVIYRSDGSLVRSMTLADILPADYARALPRSVSSLWWGGEHVLAPDGARLILKVVIPGRSASLGEDVRGFVDVVVELATGRVTPPAGPAWARASAAAAPLIARSKAEEAEWRAQMIAPLTAPSTHEDDDWRRYLYQAMRRLAPRDPKSGFGHAEVLPPASDPAFEQRRKEVAEIVAEWDDKSDLAFASPSDPQALATLLEDAAMAAPAGRLTGPRLFVALPASLASGVRTALERSGAAVIVFDPAIPIPQRAEVLAEANVVPDQVETEADRASADARRFRAEAARLEAATPPIPATEGADERDLEAMADRLEAEADRLEAAAGSEPR